jgi:hypothetical protein
MKFTVFYSIEGKISIEAKNEDDVKKKFDFIDIEELLDNSEPIKIDEIYED